MLAGWPYGGGCDKMAGGGEVRLSVVCQMGKWWPGVEEEEGVEVWGERDGMCEVS